MRIGILATVNCPFFCSQDDVFFLLEAFSRFNFVLQEYGKACLLDLMDNVNPGSIPNRNVLIQIQATKLTSGQTVNITEIVYRIYRETCPSRYR